MGSELMAKHDHLTVIAQPCNQFSGQEPKDGKELYDQIQKRWGPTGRWIYLKKAKVNGPGATDLYKFLKHHENTKRPWYLPDRIYWNYEKFVVGPDGVPRKRFAYQTAPLDMDGLIAELRV